MMSEAAAAIEVPLQQEEPKKVYAVPREIDLEVAAIKAAALGAGIDVLSDEQKEYLSRCE